MKQRGRRNRSSMRVVGGLVTRMLLRLLVTRSEAGSTCFGSMRVEGRLKQLQQHARGGSLVEGKAGDRVRTVVRAGRGHKVAHAYGASWAAWEGLVGGGAAP